MRTITMTEVELVHSKIKDVPILLSFLLMPVETARKLIKYNCKENL